MDKATRNLLTDEEQKLVRRTEAPLLGRLDEEELVELHDRVRRARNKYAKLHRRQAAAQVGKDAARGVAAKRNQKTARKAEVFETALAQVSHQLAKVATERAAELRAARIAAASSGSGGKGRKPKASSKGKNQSGKRTKAERRRATSHVSDRRAASTRAEGKRKQAKRDKKR